MVWATMKKETKKKKNKTLEKKVYKGNPEREGAEGVEGFTG